MKQTTSFNTYLIKILIISALFFTLPIVFSIGGNLSTTDSYIRSSLCFFSLTIVSVSLLLGRKYTFFYSVVFLLILALGLCHYLTFIDPHYFSSNGTPVDSFWGEYQAVFSSVDGLIRDRHSNGLLYFDSDSWYVTHSEIWRIISWPFTFLGHKWLSYSPLNVFSSLLASTNLMVVFNHNYPDREGDYKNARRVLLYATAFFPMFLLNDNFYRDPFGTALVSTGLALITLSKTLPNKVLSYVVLGFSSFILRSVYIVIAGAAIAIRDLRVAKKGTKILLMPLFAVALIILYRVFDNYETGDYVGSYVNSMSFLAFPLKVLFALIGPFPWTQFSYVYIGLTYYSYQLADYLLGVFQLGYLFAIISRWKRLSLKNADYLTIMGLGMMIAGILTKVMHIGYIAEGVFFTLPWFFKYFGKEFGKYFSYSLLVLVLLNILVTIFGIHGISGSWR